MSGAWPPLPDWLRVELAPNPVRRGERVRVNWEVDPPGSGHELRLTLVVQREAPGPGDRLATGRGIWTIHDRTALDAGGAAFLRVPADAPYSYPGTLLAFLWGIALGAVGDPADRSLGWTALRVLP